MYLNLNRLRSFRHYVSDKLEHEMYLNCYSPSFRGKSTFDKLEHEMYLNIMQKSQFLADLR